MSDTDYISGFLTHLTNKRKTSQNTLLAYEKDLKSFFSYLEIKKVSVTDVSSKDISKYKDSLASDGKSVATVSRVMSTLRSFYKYLVVSDVCSSNPAAVIKNDKGEKKFFEVLSEDEIDKLLASPDSSDFKGMRDSAMLELLYATGMKIGELLSLDISDVNLRMHCINCRSSKSSGNRMILIYPKAVKVLSEYISKARGYFVSSSAECALFVNVNGDRMTRQGFWKLLKIYAENAGISKSITPHTLRHSFATHLLKNGADIHDIKNILGHSDISSTQVYSDYIKSTLDNSYLKFNHRSR